MLKFLSIAAVALGALSAASVANAQPLSWSYLNKDGEIIDVVMPDESNSFKAFWAVVAVVEKAGYTRIADGYFSPSTKTDTRCKVEAYDGLILSECYTPRIGRGLSVHDQVTTRTSDYSQVPTMVAQIRYEHRSASAFLGIK